MTDSKSEFRTARKSRQLLKLRISNLEDRIEAIEEIIKEITQPKPQVQLKL